MAFSNTMEALNAGVAIIYQELHLIPEMTVAENIYLGQLPHRGGIVNRSLLNYEARLQLEHLGLDIDPETPLKYLSIGQWQMVEIAKALARNAKIIAFDEPTSSLSAREIDNLFRVIRELREEGRVIIMFHTGWKKFLRSAMPSPSLRMAAMSAPLTIWRASATTRWSRRWWDATWAIYMAGSHDRTAKSGCAWRRSKLRACVRRSVSRYAVGEIVGLFGLVGAGRSELMKGLFGGTRITGGQVYIDGQPVDIRKPAQAIQAGMMLCPEDRKADGIIPVHSVRDNINISARRKHIHAGCLINNAWEADNAAQHIQSLNIKTPGPEQLIMNLSGGNQQKAILGRWLSEEMKVILLDEPTRGIDVGAKHEIYNVIYGLAASGVAVVFASSDLPEVLGVADRIVVMREGQIAGELLHEDANEQQALSLAMPKVSQAVA